MSVAGGTASAPINDPWRKETLRLIELDEKATVEMVARMVAVQTATRAAMIPIAAAFGGLALTNHRPVLAYVALPVLLIALIIETRAALLQGRAHNRSTYLERIIQTQLSALAAVGTPVEAQAIQALRKQLGGYQFGTSRSLRTVGARDLVRGAHRRAASWLYLGLAVLLVTAGVIAAITAPKPAEVCLQTGTGTIVRISGSGITLSGAVKVVPCPPS